MTANSNGQTGSVRFGRLLPVTCSLFFLVVVLPAQRIFALEEERSKFIEVTTKYGKVRGERMLRRIPELGEETVSQLYDRFLGVPYAEPPLGRLRFAAPEPPTPWSDVMNTTSKQPSCTQPVYELEVHYVHQDEDCLYLNIFTPFEEDNPGAKYPVILYIHGGSFESGSGHVYDGKVLSSLGVVVVTINYRLGALGFLTSGDDILPGNYGVRDQLAAMKWVNENIAMFRGDPGRVTLVGHSVGASSVGLMMTIGEAKGLYHAVIAQSGSASALYSCYNSSFSAQFQEYVRKVGQLLSCPNAKNNNGSKEAEREEILKIRDCLREKDVQVFMDKRFSFPLYDRMGVEFRPYVDGKLIQMEPREAFKVGAYNKVPFFTGIVEREFNFYFEQSSSNLDNERPDATFEQYLLRSFNNQKDIVKLIRFMYTNWSSTDNASKFKYEEGEVLSDFHMVAPTIQLADVLSRHQEQVYYYYFRHPLSYHSIELSYLFGTPFGADPGDESGKVSYATSTDGDRKLSLYFMKQWRAIARDGKPSVLGQVQWPQYNRDSRLFLNMSSEIITVSRNLRQNKAFFWNEILPLVFPESRSVLGSGLTSFDKYPSAIDDYITEVEDRKRHDFLVIVALSVAIVIAVILLVILIGWLARLKIEIEELKKVAKLYSVSYVV